ncbi:MAG: sugar phosphate isomerase/epimerase [Chloroflexi bacterium]|nr:sugar phosphate isomerase/epimerase [Chloroflexota bacterium]
MSAPGSDGAAQRPLLALSTMWAVQPRFERDLGAFMERAAELGYEAIEINHSMDAEQIGAILGHATLPVTAVHAPAPLERDRRRGWNRGLNLASTDEDERALAVHYTQRSVDVAAEAGAQSVVVHLGSVGERAISAATRLREMYPRWQLAGDGWEQAIFEARRERALQAPPYLAQARRSLDELVAYAEPKSIALGLECRLRYHQIPLPEEMVDLLAPYPREAAGYWHDVGHAEVLHRLGLVELGAWFDLLGERLLGTHLHDVDGLQDHRAPGLGNVDFAWLAGRLPATAARTFEINQSQPDEAVRNAIVRLGEAGVIAGP